MGQRQAGRQSKDRQTQTSRRVRQSDGQADGQPDRQAHTRDACPTEGQRQTSRRTAGQLGGETNRQADSHTGGNPGRGTARQGRKTDRWTGKGSTQETPGPQGPEGSEKGINVCPFSRDWRSFSGTSGRPSARPSPSTDTAGPLMFPAGPGRPPRPGSRLPKFTLYIQDGSVFLKVVGAG